MNETERHVNVAHVVADSSSITSVSGVDGLAVDELAGAALLLISVAVLSFRLRRAPKIDVLLGLGLGLGESMSGDIDAYPESSDKRDVALPALRRE